MNLKEEFIKYIRDNRHSKSINLFLDIETLQYNEEKGRKKPSEFKNVTFSVAVGWLNKEGTISRIAVSSFKKMFDLIFKACYNSNRHTGYKCKATINLIAHNGNKYDNHFLITETQYFYPHIKIENAFLRNSIDNSLTRLKGNISKEEKETGIVLEKRVKSSNNLEAEFYLNSIHFKTIDSFMKTHVSLATLGIKLYNKGYLKKEELKTTFDYTKWNLDNDMTDEQAFRYAEYVFNQLTNEELIYIENDVIILGNAVVHYSEIFPNFDFNKITFTTNILDYYNNNPLTSFQLLNKYYSVPEVPTQVSEFVEEEIKIQYTDYYFQNENFYDYLKPFYRGGLNFYNTKYLNRIIEDYCFSMDLNSSYPHAMYHWNIPTFLEEYQDYKKETTVQIEHNEYYYLYRMSKEDFNSHILLFIDSKVIKQMLVKYYTTNSYVNINTYTLRLIEKVTGISIKELPVLSVLKYSCVPFGSLKEIAENYFIKTQGKLKNKIVMETPNQYTITDEINTNIFTKEEIDNSKVLLNGIYGIPALRAFFNLFKILPDGNIENIPNGFKNSERNIVFSIFVTSVSLYNLLEPLSFLTQKEIDDNFVYCDTDSLYLKRTIRHKIPDIMFDSIALGKWDIEHEYIEKMFVLNHKKYAYYADKKITVRCGGVRLESFDLNMSFEKFIKTQFSNGAEVKNTKSIYTKQQKIAIYESTTKIEAGKNYPVMFTRSNEKELEELIEVIKSEQINGFEDFMYIETPYGALSQKDLYPHTNEHEGKASLNVLIKMNNKIKSKLLTNV